MNTEFLGFYSQHLTLLVRQAREAGVSTEELLESTSQVFAPVIADDALEGYASSEEGMHSLLHEDGGVVTVAEAGRLYRPKVGATRQAVTQQIQRGHLIAIKTGQRGFLLPVWQFASAGGLIHGLDKVLIELRKHPFFDSFLPFTFLLQQNPLTQGDKPLDALRKGRIDEVLTAAAAEGR